MRKSGFLFAAGLGLILEAACAAPAELVVKTGPGTEYPCGVNGVVCAVEKTCCDQGETCGGEPASVGCPDGMCCFVGVGNYGARKPHKQKPQVSQVPQS